MAEKEKKANIFKRMAAWFKSLRSESKKVVWANAASVRKNTLVVIICVIIIAAVLGLVDYLLSGAVVGLGRLI